MSPIDRMRAEHHALGRDDLDPPRWLVLLARVVLAGFMAALVFVITQG